MNFKYIKVSPFFFGISYLLIVILFSIISYNFLIRDFVKLEEQQNKNNINTILSVMNSEIKNIKNITNDYSKWDNTYKFLNDFNQEYLYENFREGTTTLDDLGIDFILYLDLNQNIVFSKYSTEIFSNNRNNFEKKLLKRFDYLPIVNTFFKYKSHTMYIIKSKILKSDESGVSNGYIYSGKIINNKRLNDLTKVFKNIYLINKYSNVKNLEFNLEYINDIKVKVAHKNEQIVNNIQFFDDNANYIFSIWAENRGVIVDNGQRTILIFDAIISIFLFVMLYIIYKNQNILERYNEMLKSKVSRRTNQLSKTLRKLKTKNRELYTLANMDTMTKINNRRSYFKKSEKALKDSILTNSELSVLMMDIDHFKKINDTFGHAVGDKVLINFCTIVNSLIDENAIFGRIGGEEFCITFVNKHIDDVANIAEEIRNICSDATLIVDDKEITFTLSLGLSKRNNIKSIDEILQISDELLYKAKKSGRNRLIRTTVH